MINQTKKQSTWLYSLSLPAFLVLLFIFSGKESTHHLKVITDKVTETVAAVAPQNEYKPSILPLKNVEDVTLKSSFGMRIHPVLKVEKMHEGVDFKTQEGNVVLATAKGTVIEAGSINKIGGLKVVIDHNGLYQTAYAHLSEIKVKEGDEVKLNDEIGLSGRTGQAVAPHLHYEVKETGRGFVDPLLFINDFYFNPQKNTPIKKEEAKEKPVKKAGQKFRVVIDPGHGGADKGTNSSELWEKDIVLKIALDIAESFVDSDKVEIMLSRRDDQLLSLDDRVLLTENADLFISLHVEDHENQEERMMVPIYRDVGVYAEQSKMFADLLAAEFTKENKEIRVAYTRGYKVLENAKCPAILFNIGYVSNKDTDHYLNSKNGRDEVATEISDAISAASL